MLDAIFADCFGRWGGRFNLLVPCENGVIRPSYVPWLGLYDPDIIYSYVDLAHPEIALIHEWFYPAFLVRHDFGRRDGRDERAFRPGLPMVPLGALSATIGAAHRDFLSPRHPIAIIDIQLGQKPSQFIQENFGYYGESLTPAPMADDMAELVRTVTFAPVADSQRIPRRMSEDFVTRESELLELISKRRDLIGLSQLAAWQCPRLEFHDHRWADSVNLVVGDSFVDRIIFWNARSHLSVGFDSGLVTLKTSMEQLADPGFFSTFLDIIRKRIRFANSGSSNTHFKLRSATLPQPDLEALGKKFQTEDKQHYYSSEPPTTLDTCVPTSEALKHSRSLVEDFTMFYGQDWHEFTFSESRFRPPLVYPRHLRDVRPLPLCANRGGWALDLDIERTVDYSRFQNVQHHWRLPFRLRMVDAFLKEYQPTGNAPICKPRATRGLLGLFGFVGSELPEITIPTDETAFRIAICGPRTWWPFDRRSDEQILGAAVDMRPSDKGRYLTALLQRAGGIHQAAEMFLQQFWKEQFDNLGATTSSADNQCERIVRTLQKRLKGGVIGSQQEWQRIADVVQSEARQIRFPNRCVRFDQLTEDFESFRNAFWQKNQAGAPREEWDENEKRSLSESLQYLCQREILYQGHEWLCPRCYNKNWVSIAALAQSMTCEVCRHTAPAPVNDPWHFKLDAFILEGLREHSMLSYLWCLHRLAGKAQVSFYFLEPYELFYSEETANKRKSDAEIDLLAVGDGIVRLCEIKAASRGIDIEKLATVAKRIRPNIATLAVMEPPSSYLSAKLSELETALGGTGIASELIYLRQQDVEPSPILPTGRRFRVQLL